MKNNVAYTGSAAYIKPIILKSPASNLRSEKNECCTVWNSTRVVQNTMYPEIEAPSMTIKKIIIQFCISFAPAFNVAIGKFADNEISKIYIDLKNISRMLVASRKSILPTWFAIVFVFPIKFSTLFMSF